MAHFKWALNDAFSDYDLSLVCIAKCDDEYMQCVSTCSSTDCLMECNRAWATCGDCKFTFINYWSEGPLLKITGFIFFI